MGRIFIVIIAVLVIHFIAGTAAVGIHNIAQGVAQTETLANGAGK